MVHGNTTSSDLRSGVKEGQSRYSPARPVPTTSRGHEILDRFKVTDQVAIVTGSGRGIGAASAVALAEAGADIVLAARTEEQLREVARRVAATGRRAAVVAGDLTDLELMGSLADTARQAFGRVDIVVNNLGGTMPRPLLDTSPHALEEAFHFNVAPATPWCAPPSRSCSKARPPVAPS